MFKENTKWFSVLLVICTLLGGLGGYGYGFIMNPKAPVTNFLMDINGNLDVNSIETNTARIDALTSGRIPIAGANGLLGDSSNLTFTGGNTLNVPNLNVTLSLYVNSNKFYPVNTNSFTVWNSTGTIYCRNELTGAVTSGANAATLIESVSVAGAHFFVKNGEYKLPAAANFTIDENNVVLEGESRNGVVFRVPTGSTAVHYIYVTGTNVLVKSLSVNGNYANVVNIAGEKSQTGIFFETTGDYGVAEDCYVYDTCGMGIFSYGDWVKILANYVRNTYDSQIQINGNYALISNNHVYGGATSTIGGGIELENGDWNTVTTNYMNQTVQGLRLSGSSYNMICDTSIHNTKAIGLYVGTDSNYNQIKNSLLYTCKYGIEVNGADASHTVHNVLDGGSIYGVVTNAGIYLTKGAYNSVENFEILNPASQGIDVTTTTYARILKNTITNPGSSYNIRLTAVTDSQICDNTAGSSRIYETGACDRNTYTGNRGGTAGTYVGANNKIYRNYNYVTESSGTAGSIALGVTHQHITHGLSYTPTAADIGITWTTSLTNCTSWAVTGISSTEFVVNLYDATGAAKGPSGTVTYSWKVIKTP